MGQQLPPDVGHPLPPAPGRTAALAAGGVILLVFVANGIVMTLAFDGWSRLVPIGILAIAAAIGARVLGGGERTYLSPTRLTRTRWGRATDSIEFADVRAVGFDDAATVGERESRIVVGTEPGTGGARIVVADGPHGQWWPLVQRLDLLVREKHWLVAPADRSTWDILVQRNRNKGLANPSATAPQATARTVPIISDQAEERRAEQSSAGQHRAPVEWDGIPWDGTPRP